MAEVKSGRTGGDPLGPLFPDEKALILKYLPLVTLCRFVYHLGIVWLAWFFFIFFIFVFCFLADKRANSPKAIASRAGIPVHLGSSANFC
jgi:hypothetical protein